MRRVSWLAGLAGSLALLVPAGAPAASLEPVGSFAQPIFVSSDPDDPDRFFVVERDHPEQVDAINAGIDRFFDSLPSRRAEQPDRFVAELHEALPERYAKQAEAIYLRHAASS
jgi:hypothetical protein